MEKKLAVPQHLGNDATRAKIHNDTLGYAQPNKEEYSQSDVTHAAGTGTPAPSTATVPGKGTGKIAETGQMASNIRSKGYQARMVVINARIELDRTKTRLT